MTGQGIVADLITTGQMLFDRIKGGTATLGGSNNVNGRLIVLDANGETVADIGYNNGGFGSLNVGQLTSPSIYNVNRNDLSFSASADGGITDALSQIANLNEGNVTITLTADISDEVIVQNIIGNGQITIDLGGHTLGGSITCRGCAPTYIKVTNGLINTKDVQGILVDRCAYVVVDGCKVYGNNVSGHGVLVEYGGKAFITNSEMYDVAEGVTCCYSAQATVIDCKGLGSTYGIVAYNGGVLVASGTVPDGSTATSLGTTGIISGSYSSNTGSATPPAPPSTTATISSVSADNWSTSGYWDGTNLAKQGNYGYGTRTGLWFFGTGISSVLNGKTIQSMKLYVERYSGGGASGARTVRIRWHSYASKPSGAPSPLTLSNEYVDISLAWGKSGWVTIPSNFYSYFQSGSAKGFGIYYDTGSTNYLAMISVAKLQVTYA
jgi:hypothetical protein